MEQKVIVFENVIEINDAHLEKLKTKKEEL